MLWQRMDGGHVMTPCTPGLVRTALKRKIGCRLSAGGGLHATASAGVRAESLKRQQERDGRHCSRCPGNGSIESKGAGPQAGLITTNQAAHYADIANAKAMVCGSVGRASTFARSARRRDASSSNPAGFALPSVYER